MKFSPTVDIDYGALNWTHHWHQAIVANRRIRIRFYDFLAGQIYVQFQVAVVPLPGWPNWGPVPVPMAQSPIILVHVPPLHVLVQQAFSAKGYYYMTARYKSSGPKQLQIKLE